MAGEEGSPSTCDHYCCCAPTSPYPGPRGWVEAGCFHLTGPGPKQRRNWRTELWPRAWPMQVWEVGLRCYGGASWVPQPYPSPPTDLRACCQRTYQPGPAQPVFHPRPSPSLLAPENAPGRQPWGQAHLSPHLGMPLLPASLSPTSLHSSPASPILVGGPWSSSSVLLSPLSFLLSLPFSSSSPGGKSHCWSSWAIAPPTTADPDGPRIEGYWAPWPPQSTHMGERVPS